MTTRARAGLSRYLTRRAPPPKERVATLELASGPLRLVVRRHARARQLTLRVAPDGSEARVTVPTHVALTEGESFARSRLDWLERQRRAIPSRRAIGPGAQLPYRDGTLQIEWDRLHPRRPVLEGRTLRLGGPRESLSHRVHRWLESEALRLTEEDLVEFCAAAGIGRPPLRISRALRRWGSCAANGTIRINWRLIMAPDAVRRSVVAHEVAHLIHFDHSPRFHAALAVIFGSEIAQAETWLRREGRSLYAPFG